MSSACFVQADCVRFGSFTFRQVVAVFIAWVSFMAVSCAQEVISPVATGLLSYGTVNAMAVQSDGKLVIGGSFTRIGTEFRTNLARFNADGTLDDTWKPGLNGIVWAVAIDAADNLYVGGDFTTVNAGPYGIDGPPVRFGIARLPASGGGSPDGWSPSLPNTRAIALDGAGSAFVAFGQFNGGKTMVKVPTDQYPEIDSAWNPAPDRPPIFSLVADGAGSLYAVGLFTSIGGFARKGIAKISTSGKGAVDPAWNPAPDQPVVTIAVDASKRVYVAGAFTSIGGKPRRCIARLFPSGNGDADDAWSPAFTDLAPDETCLGSAIAVGPSGQVVLTRLMYPAAADFLSIPPRDFKYTLSRIDSAGMLLTTLPIPQRLRIGFFDLPQGRAIAARGDRIFGNGFVFELPGDISLPGWGPVLAPGVVKALALDKQGRIIVAGEFDLTEDGTSRRGLARVLPDGQLDRDWDPQVPGLVRALVIDDNDDVFATGTFLQVGSEPRARIAKLSHVDGAPDPRWNPGLDRAGFALTRDGQRNLYVGGQFSQVGGVARKTLAKLSTTTGSVDGEWLPQPDGGVASLTSDGASLFVGGGFTSIGGQLRSGLAKLRLDGNGDADPSWNPPITPHSVVTALSLDGNGRLYVGSSFSGDRPLRRTFTSGTGAFDPSWGPVFSGNITSISMGPEETLYAAGSSYPSSYSFPISRALRVLTDGTGSVYAGWGGRMQNVYAVLADAVSGFHAGGDFCSIQTSLAVVYRNCGYARLTATPTRVAPFDLDGNGRYDALTDGLMLIRYLLGVRGQALTAGATGRYATQISAGAVETHAASWKGHYDLDANGSEDALTDGLLFIRYLFGIRGPALIDKAIGPGSRVIPASAIESYIEQLLNQLQ